MNYAEYIWIDGVEPTPGIRSKTRVLNLGGKKPEISDFPLWGFDGSSTSQAAGNDSDCELVPVSIYPDPIRGEGHYLVLCEVYTSIGKIHPSNTRAILRQVLSAGAEAEKPWVGFEQEYTLFKDGRPLGFPENGEPAPQGPYYCGAGAARAYGRDIVELHAKWCLEAGLTYFGLNAEVMPGQWEFQIGYRGNDSDEKGLLAMSDHIWIGRWLLERAAENYGVEVSFHNKPWKGDWNGAGMHTNFSTASTRSKTKGTAAIARSIKNLSTCHNQHIAVYGAGLDERLTGAHETCSIHEFRSGDGDRGASIRIPLTVKQKGYGYFEDRRPGANADPYQVSARLAVTVCELEEKLLEAGETKPQKRGRRKAA